MTIQIRKREVYGNEMLYPVCKKAKLFAQIAGTKTLTLYTIGQISELGYEIEMVV